MLANNLFLIVPNFAQFSGRFLYFLGKMLLDLEANINELEKWNTGKGLILAGAGGTFCSGGDRDLVEILNKSDGVLMSEFMHTVTNKLFNLPLVSAAVINGYALGGGACLATACDFRIMSSSAKIGFVQVRMNVSPGWGGGARLVKLVGRSKALELMMSGRIVDSGFAQECGLANEIIPDNTDICQEGENWLLNSVRGNADTIQVLKRIVATAADNDMKSSLAAERQEFSKLWASPLHLEAFRKKTKHKK